MGVSAEGDWYRNMSVTDLHSVRRRTMVPLQRIMDRVRPTDAPTWDRAFRHIEDNHAALSPEYWQSYLDDIKRRGITTPVVIYSDEHGSALLSGHHRIWAAGKLAMPEVPAWETNDLARGLRLMHGQAAREGDWAKKPRA